MPANTTPVFPLTPVVHTTDLSAVTACTTRAPTATASLAGANISALTPVSTNGKRIDFIRVKGSSSSFTAPTAAQTVTIWYWDAVLAKAFPYAEILVALVTPSTTAVSFEGSIAPVGLVLPAADRLYVSTSITTTASTTAFVVQAFGGDY